MRENILNNTVYSDGFKLRRYKHIKNHRYIKLAAVGVLWVFFGCKVKKQLVVTRVPVDTVTRPIDTKNLKINAIRFAQTHFNTFSAKARTKLDINGDNNDVTLNIRIKRDHKIWVSVTAIAGIEVARALITPDSILLINRLQALYVKQPFSYVYQFAGRQVSYTTLESLLIGNIIPDLVNESAVIQTVNNNTEMSGTLQALVYKLILGPDLKATQTNMNDHAAGQSLTVNNAAFIQVANRIIPSQIDMASMVNNKKIQVNLHYIKTDFDQALEYPFSIPSRYSPAN